MPIAASGTLSLNGTTATRSLGLEIGTADETTVSLNDPFLRTLAGVASGQISFSSFYGKTYTEVSGGLWTWGDGLYGQLGDNTRTNRSSPVQTVSGGTNWRYLPDGQGRYLASSIKSDGTLWVWGYNVFGSIGDNTRTNRSSPVQTVSGGTNWRESAGGYISFAATKTDGTLWNWGGGDTGNLGTNNITSRSSPVQTVAGGTNWRSRITRGGTFWSGGIKTDNTLWCWGRLVGDNTRTNRSSPVQTIAGGTNWRQASGFMYNDGCVATKTDGTLWGWMDDDRVFGAQYSSPIQVFGGGTNWKQAYGGLYAAYGIKTDGTLWRIGNDNVGTASSSPTQVVSGQRNWYNFSGQYYGIHTVYTNGTLWGYAPTGSTFSPNGSLGDNGYGGVYSLVQTVAGGTGWKKVSAGDRHVVAIKS